MRLAGRVSVFGVLLAFSFCSFLPGCSKSSLVLPKIDHRPAPSVWRSKGELVSIPDYDPYSAGPIQVDLRGRDLSALDLRGSHDKLLYATFDSRTIWPPAARMPRGFDWRAIVEMGKNPGLGVRGLHARGITGRGVGIAIIDQPLLTGHEEYASRLRLYEEVNIRPNEVASMHGGAVASIAVGRTVGVAPGADLYFVANWPVDLTSREPNPTPDPSLRAQAIRRIIAINRDLPRRGKIRVLSMSFGCHGEALVAAKEAADAGMLVVFSNMEEMLGQGLYCLGRSPLADPDRIESYEPGLFWAVEFYASRHGARDPMFPMDSRTTASPGGADEYVFYRDGGLSWSIPYMAGLYALAAQVEPKITPQRFCELLRKTSRWIELDHGGKRVPFGPIADPAALIAALEGK